MVEWLVYIIASAIVIIGGLLWIITGIGKVADDMMDDIVNPDKYENKEKE